MKLKIIVLFMFASMGCLFSQSIARVDSFYMPSLGKTKKLTVLLPGKYSPKIRYPILYLLHGYSGTHSDWSTRTKIAEYVKDNPLIVVMPDGENSWYVNSATAAEDRFEDYIINDIQGYIQMKYAVDTTRQGIAGLSMGGYGALMLALKHPSKFRFAGSLSGAITFPRDIGDTLRPAERSLAPSLRRAYGERNNGFRSTHDVFYLYRQTAKETLPYMYLVIGVQDGFRNFLPAHRAFTDLLRAYGAAYEYHETPGGHSWQYWDREIQPLLKRMREVLNF